MKLKLISDFSDYYDHHMDLEADHVLRRVSTEGLGRIGQFHLMERHGLKVARTVWSFANVFSQVETNFT